MTIIIKAFSGLFGDSMKAENSFLKSNSFLTD